MGENDDVWAVGDAGEMAGTVVRRRNGKFELLSGVPKVNLGAITRGAVDEMWIAGQASTVLRIKGDTVTPIMLPGGVNMDAIWASGPDDIWVSGGTIYRIRAGVPGLVRGAPPPSNFLRQFSIWGNSPDSIWFVGNEGQLWYWNGTLIERIATYTGADFFTVTGHGPNELLLAGENSAILRLERKPQ